MHCHNHNRRQEPIQIIRNIMAIVSEQKRAFDLERERRQAWETQQEIKVAGDRAELESRIASMQREIDDLKSRLSSSVDGVSTNTDSQHPAPTCDDLPSNMYTFPPEASQGADNKSTSAVAQGPLLGQATSSQNADTGLPLPEFVEGSSISPSISPSEEQPRKRMRTRSPSHTGAPSATARSHSRHNQPRSIMVGLISLKYMFI